MTHMSTIQVRTNDKTKKKAQKVLRNLGLDLSTAINMYLVQIIVDEGIPFPILTENGMTMARKRKLRQEAEWAMKYGKRYTSTKEMFKDILRK